MALDHLAALARAAKWGFFLRAETMHGFYSYLEAHPGRNDPQFHALSHGESFLEILRTRFESPGLYCLDEPEAAMSLSAQLVLMGTMHDLATSGAQLLCATHSPLLAALPEATILELGPGGLRRARYEELELVAHWKAYLADPCDTYATSPSLSAAARRVVPLIPTRRLRLRMHTHALVLLGIGLVGLARRPA